MSAQELFGGAITVPVLGSFVDARCLCHLMFAINSTHPKD